MADDPTKTEKPSKLPAIAAGLGAAGVAAPLLYNAIRRPTYSTHAGLRAIQKASKGRFARTIHDKPKSRAGQWLQKKLYDADELKHISEKQPKKPMKFEGAVHHFDPEWGPKYLKGTVNPGTSPASQGLSNRIAEDKWREYLFFEKHAPGSMARTQSMQQVMRQMGVKRVPKDPKKQRQLMDELQGRLGKSYGTEAGKEAPGGYLLKEIGGAQSAGVFPQEKHNFGSLLSKSKQKKIQSKLDKLDKQLDKDEITSAQWEKAFKELRGQEGFAGRVLEQTIKNPRNVVVQQKVPIAETTGLRRLVSKALGQPASKEIRVHVIGGKAVPELATARFDPTMGLFERKLPREASEYAQSIVDKLPKNVRQTEFGMDIAPLQGGGFKLIEANPGGQSGLLHPEKGPLAPFRLRKAMTGQWSPTVAGAGAGAGALAAGGAAYGGTRAVQGALAPPTEQKVAAAPNGQFKGVPMSPHTVKKVVNFQGVEIRIDRPKGFIMWGRDDKGETWSRKYKYDYGFIPKTLGGDGDGLDVFIGPIKDAKEAYWAVQRKHDGTFDEYKVFMGFPNRDAAIGAYKEHIPGKLLTSMVTMKVEMMRAMLGMEPAHSLDKTANLKEKYEGWKKDRRRQKLVNDFKQLSKRFGREGMKHELASAFKELADEGLEAFE